MIKRIKNTDGYMITDRGEVFNPQGRRINGWINYTRNSEYIRVWIKYHDGWRQEYVHILVAIYFLGGDQRSMGKIALHGPRGSLCNRADNLSWGTHLKNQTQDRLRDGNYYNRGQCKEPITDEQTGHDDLPF